MDTIIVFSVTYFRSNCTAIYDDDCDRETSDAVRQKYVDLVNDFDNADVSVCETISFQMSNCTLIIVVKSFNVYSIL